MSASVLLVSGQFPKLVDFSKVVPFAMSCAALRLPGTLPQMAGLPGKMTRSAREAKEVDMPQLEGTLPSKLLLCSAMVVRLAKQFVVPQVEGKLPVIWLP